MRRLTVVLSMGALAAVVIGCQTITEELPTKPGTVVVGGGTGGGSAVVVVPVQLPSPQAPLPPPSSPRPIPTAEPGGGGGTGGGGGGGGGGGQPNNNSAPVRLGAKVFFVECDGQEVPNSEHATEAPVGCRVHLDVTPKDASNKPTQVRNVPTWSFSNEGIIRVSKKQDFTPTFTAVGAGTVDCYAEADGLRSNTVSIRLK
jgi:hypothetical protein